MLFKQPHMRWVLTVVLLMFAVGSQAHDSAPQTTEAALAQQAEAILQDMDAGYYLYTWEKASSLLQVSMPQALFVEAVKHERRGLGAVIERHLESSQRHDVDGDYVPQGSYANVMFSSVFKRHEKAVTERLSFYYEADNTWRFLGYKLIRP